MELYPMALKTGYSFVTWLDAEGNELSKDSVAQDKIYYARYVDDIVPEISVAATADIASEQTISIDALDEGSGVAGYYIGLENPKEIAVSYTTANAIKVNETGTYYCSVVDNDGNVSATGEIAFNKISLNPNGGSVASEVVLVENGTTMILPDAEKKGYSGCWHDEETDVIVTETEVTGEDSFIMKWEPNQYIISFDGNGGTCSAEPITVTFDSKYGNLPTPTRSGYSFLGWYTVASGGEKIASTNDVSINNDHTLYAHWKANQVLPSPGYWVCGYGVFSHTDSAGNIKAKCGTCGAGVDAIGAEHRIYK